MLTYERAYTHIILPIVGNIVKMTKKKKLDI